MGFGPSSERLTIFSKGVGAPMQWREAARHASGKTEQLQPAFASQGEFKGDDRK